MPRLFVGVPAPEDLSLPQVTRELSEDDNLKLVDPELYHVTLAFMGDTPEDRVEDALEAIREGASQAKAQAHEARARGLGAFPNPGRASVLWAGIRDGNLEPLAKQVRSALSSRSIAFDDRHGFHPHMTVARLRDRDDVSALLQEHESTDFGAFPIEDVHLYESTLTPQGPDYEVRGTVELG